MYATAVRKEMERKMYDTYREWQASQSAWRRLWLRLRYSAIYYRYRRFVSKWYGKNGY